MLTDPPIWTPTIIAHRGGAAETPFPEDSREAFAAARADGFACECDVWASSDGVPVVIHDGTLHRTTLAEGNAWELPSESLGRIALRSPHGSASGIPMLHEVAHEGMLVEIKPSNATDLVHAVIATMPRRPWTLMSFNADNLVHALKIDPSLHVALLAGNLHAVDAAIKAGWPAYLDHKRLDKATARHLRNANLLIGVWTVNTEDDLHRIRPFRPDIIITDKPRLMRKWLETAGQT